MLRNIGFTEILIVLLVVVLIFGAGKLPQLARSMGEGIREFKKSVKGGEEAGDQKSAEADKK